jgi:3D (Asp-Asp-Asp) domain-containing protein
MNGVLPTGSSSLLQTYLSALREAEAKTSATGVTGSASAGSTGSTGSAGNTADSTGGFDTIALDPSVEQTATMSFISHVDAECFISLLQMMDPKPTAEEGKAQNQRYYAQLRSVLVIPAPPPDPARLGLPADTVA